MKPASIVVRAALQCVPNRRLSILIFHRVLLHKDPLRPSEPTVDEFDATLGWLKEWFNVVPLGDAIRALKGNSLPPRACAITFDDGYADNFELALPVLQRHRMPATFFVATGYLDGGAMFNDRVIEAIRAASKPELDLTSLGWGTHPIASAIDKRTTVDRLLKRVKYMPPRDRDPTVDSIVSAASAGAHPSLMMTSDQVRALAVSGMEVGAHTVSHPILNEVEIDEARDEICMGRSRLEEITGRRVSIFAYPNGRPGQDYSAAHVSLIRELGFDGAVSTASGTAGFGCDPFQLPRFTPWDESELKFGLRLAAVRMKSRYAQA